MGERTKISWTDHTFNIWWGCEHAPADAPDDRDRRLVDGRSLPVATSPECDHCYAEAFDNRVGGDHWGATAPRRFFGETYWAKLRRWNAAAERAGERRRVFVSSMADWAEQHPDPEINAKMDGAREALWREVRASPWLDFLLLTKRAERLSELLPWMRGPGAECDWCCGSDASGGHERSCPAAMPWPNVWPGVTAGTRRSLWRVRKLREVRAAMRFVSCEPLLEHITAEDWYGVLGHDVDMEVAEDGIGGEEHILVPRVGGLGRIDLLIVGDESGARRRHAQAMWVRAARDAAERHGVAFHLKQLHIPEAGGVRGKNGLVHLPIFDGRRHDGMLRGPE